MGRVIEGDEYERVFQKYHFDRPVLQATDGSFIPAPTRSEGNTINVLARDKRQAFVAPGMMGIQKVQRHQLDPTLNVTLPGCNFLLVLG